MLNLSLEDQAEQADIAPAGSESLKRDIFNILSLFMYKPIYG